MGVQNKNHAKEYLSEFSQNQKLWYRYLITEAINTNGNISDEVMAKIYICLKGDLNIERFISTIHPRDNLDNISEKVKLRIYNDLIEAKHLTLKEIFESK